MAEGCVDLKIDPMRKMLSTYLNNFFPLVRRTVVLLFRNRNRPDIHIEFLNETNKAGRSFLSVKAELENVLFLKIDDEYYPIHHDRVSLELSIPLQRDHSRVIFKGIGCFKSTKELVLKVDEVRKVILKSLEFDRKGELKSSVKGLHNSRVINNKTPKLKGAVVEVLERNAELRGTDVLISFPTIEISYPKSLTIDLHEEDLNYELNQKR